MRDCLAAMAHALRTPQVDLPAILAAPNPHIDLRLDAYDASTRNFSKAVASYAARVVAEITQRRNAHAAELKKIADRAQVIEAETNRCKMKEIELVASGCPPSSLAPASASLTAAPPPQRSRRKKKS